VADLLIGADTTSWYIGLGLGAVVVAVAVVIVVSILVLANRIAGQAETAVGAVDAIKAQTDELWQVAKINDSGVRILHAARALRKTAVGH
jgi:ABC-type transport system involved in multi-copper enzyme maturation permease subunit